MTARQTVKSQWRPMTQASENNERPVNWTQLDRRTMDNDNRQKLKPRPNEGWPSGDDPDPDWLAQPVWTQPSDPGRPSPVAQWPSDPDPRLTQTDRPDIGWQWPVTSPDRLVDDPAQRTILVLLVDDPDGRKKSPVIGPTQPIGVSPVEPVDQLWPTLTANCDPAQWLTHWQPRPNDGQQSQLKLLIEPDQTQYYCEDSVTDWLTQADSRMANWLTNDRPVWRKARKAQTDGEAWTSEMTDEGQLTKKPSWLVKVWWPRRMTDNDGLLLLVW